MRKKTNTLLGVLSFLAVTGGCSKSLAPARWQSAPVEADGKLEEWSLPLQYYDDDTKLNYALSNDDRNIYVCIRAVDSQVQMRMLRGGFTLWLDPTGKKSQAIGITYPLPSARMHKPSESGSTTRPGTDTKMNRRLMTEQNQMQLTGFKTGNGLTPLQSQDGIHVAMKVDSAEGLVYEAIVPLGTFYKDYLSGADTLKTWSVGMELHAMEMHGNPEAHAHNGGMHAGMSMGGGMGGMHMGGRMPVRNGGGSNSNLSEDKKCWSSIRLCLRN